MIGVNKVSHGFYIGFKVKETDIRVGVLPLSTKAKWRSLTMNPLCCIRNYIWLKSDRVSMRIKPHRHIQCRILFFSFESLRLEEEI